MLKEKGNFQKYISRNDTIYMNYKSILNHALHIIERDNKNIKTFIKKESNELHPLVRVAGMWHEKNHSVVFVIYYFFLKYWKQI